MITKEICEHCLCNLDGFGKMDSLLQLFEDKLIRNQVTIRDIVFFNSKSFLYVEGGVSIVILEWARGGVKFYRHFISNSQYDDQGERIRLSAECQIEPETESYTDCFIVNEAIEENQGR